jgi:hypothetical protein
MVLRRRLPCQVFKQLLDKKALAGDHGQSTQPPEAPVTKLASREIAHYLGYIIVAGIKLR